jgi:hypothetical protein
MQGLYTILTLIKELLIWNINDNNKLAVIYNFLMHHKPAHPSALGFRGPNASILQFEKSGYQINNKLDSFAELNSKVKQFLINYKWLL